MLDPANCEKISSSSVVVSSSSDNKLISSSNEIQESSSSEVSSSSVKTESSSSKVESSSDISISSSSNPESSSEESSSSLSDGYDAINNTLTDPRDGHIYKTVTIGTQVWMAENLNYLPKDTIGTIWGGLSLCGGGAWKSKEEGDCSIFGRLYETDFTDEKKDSICPDGWSLPTYNQFQKMKSYLGDNAVNKMKINIGRVVMLLMNQVFLPYHQVYIVERRDLTPFFLKMKRLPHLQLKKTTTEQKMDLLS